MVQDHLGKNTFLYPLLTHFWSQQDQSEVVWKQFWKNFFRPGTLVDPSLAPAVRGPGCPPAVPSEHWYGCLGVRLGDSEGCKPQKVGGCGWTRCPWNRILKHIAQDTARAWFRGLVKMAQIFGAFWRLFGLFLGHIVELGGTRGLFDTVKSSRTWPLATVSLRLGISPWFGAYFGRKNGCFWPKSAQIWKGTSQLRATAPGRHR